MWWYIATLGAFVYWVLFAELIDLLPYRERPSVDWQHIYAMEREIYGHTFYHDGAPRAMVR